MKKRALCPLSGVHLTIKPKTATVTTPTTRTKTIALFTFMFFEKEGALLLGKTIQKYAHQLIKTCLARAISEIISYLCSVVSFIVLDLIFDFTTNIRTLELTHVYWTVSVPSPQT